ncbi:MAG TPA: hypothetical protein VN802_11920 [Stellaceae bacterium]|nr:hypothetical protein [Stellaceae bacterium]
MIRPSFAVRPPPGWDRQPSTSAVATLIGQRRWRILVNAQPALEPAVPLPAWIRTPEQFVDWLSMRVGPRELRAYFHDLEEIARQSADLELLRFARRYLGRSPKQRRG